MSDQQTELWERRFEWQADNLKRLEKEIERLEAENAELLIQIGAEREIRDLCCEEIDELRQALNEVDDEEGDE